VSDLFRCLFPFRPRGSLFAHLLDPGVLRNTRLAKECLHRFCAECIERSLRLKCVSSLLRSFAPLTGALRSLNECPTCRVHLSSRRQLQPVRAAEPRL